MPSWLIANGTYIDGPTVNTTRYNHPIGNGSFHATETFQQLLVRDSYTISKLYIYVVSNDTTTTTVKSRKQTPPGAAADGNQSISIGDSATGAFTDAVNSDSLVDGDLFCTQFVTAGGSSLRFSIVSYILSTVSNTTPILATSYYPGLTTQAKALVRCYTIAGKLAGTATESATYYTFRVAATLSNLRIYISANTVTAVSTLITKNGANPRNQSVSIPASTSGAFEDTVNTDNVADGEDVHYQLTTGATGTSLTICSIQVKSNSEGRQVAAATPGTTTLAIALTRYVGIEGNSQSYGTDETLVQATARCSFTAKNMYVNISANTVTAASTLTLRKDTANSTLTVSVPSTLTGQFEDIDPAHAVDFVAASLINWGIVTGATGTAITIVCIGFELELGQIILATTQGKPSNMASKLMAAGLI